VAAEGEQAGLVALDQRLESAVVTAADQRDEPLVALQPEEGRSAGKSRKARGVLKSGSFHVPAEPVPGPETP
jgi:hypothetical protein